MAFPLLLILSLLNLAFAGSHADLPEEVHWKSVFPNTPMPKALKDLLPPPGDSKPSIDWTKRNSNADVGAPRFRDYDYRQSSTEIKFSGDEVASKEFKGSSKEFKTMNDPIHPFIIYSNTAPNKELKGSSKELKTMSDPIHPFIIYDDAAPSKELKGSSKEFNPMFGPINPFIIYENVGINKKSKGVNAPINPFIVYVKESKGNKNPLGHRHGNHAAVNETMYFFQKDLHPGKMVKLPLLIKTRDMSTFLPHGVAESIPFSTDKLPEILKHFSFEAESTEANAMEQTIKGCEREVMRGEQMFCATSFQSFVDSGVSKLGNNIQLLANELGKETRNPVFSIGRGIKIMGEKELVCHKMRYPYAVFLCHSIDKTVVFKVPLVGIDGTKANALAICHKDTSAWSPNHPAFLILKVKPGTVPICHFVVRDTLAWVRK